MVGASLDSAALAAAIWAHPSVGKTHQQQMEQLTMSHKKILAQVLAQH